MISLMYIGGTRPFTTPKKNRLEIFNNFLISSLSIILIYFTDYVTEIELKFSFGYLFIAGLCIILAVNVYFMLSNLFVNWRIKR